MFTGQMLFLAPNQKCQRTVGNAWKASTKINKIWRKYDAQKNDFTVAANS